MNCQTVDCLLAVPHWQNGHLAPSGNCPYRFTCKACQPYFSWGLYPSARITGKLNHGSLRNMRVVEAALGSDVEPHKQVVLGAEFLAGFIAIEIGFLASPPYFERLQLESRKPLSQERDLPRKFPALRY